jgi:hypothetical protein
MLGQKCVEGGVGVGDWRHRPPTLSSLADLAADPESPQSVSREGADPKGGPRAAFPRVQPLMGCSVGPGLRRANGHAYGPRSGGASGQRSSANGRPWSSSSRATPRFRRAAMAPIIGSSISNAYTTTVRACVGPRTTTICQADTNDVICSTPALSGRRVFAAIRCNALFGSASPINCPRTSVGHL